MVVVAVFVSPVECKLQNRVKTMLFSVCLCLFPRLPETQSFEEPGPGHEPRDDSVRCTPRSALALYPSTFSFFAHGVRSLLSLLDIPNPF